MVLDKAGFQAIIVGITRLLPTSVVWSIDPQPMVSDIDRALVTLKMTSLTSLGVDEHRRTFNDPSQPPNSLTTLEIGNRELIINVQYEAFDRGDGGALEALDRIRTMLRAETVRDQLNAINLALEYIQPSVRFPETSEQRYVSAAAFDVFLGGIGAVVSQVQVDSGWIDTVNTNNVVPGTLTP
jgi:hypothetical protein